MDTPSQFQRSVHLDKWRDAALAHGNFTASRPFIQPHYKLMTSEYLYDEGFQTYRIVTGDDFPYYADNVFVVPAPLARAHENAQATLTSLERHLEELKDARHSWARFNRLNDIRLYRT